MTPRVSIVVPVRRAPKTIRATLQALLRQCDSVDAELLAVIAEADPTLRELATIADARLRILVMPGRRGVPQLRRDGVLHAHAPCVVITEDHCLFSQNWLSTLLEYCEQNHVVCGGPVANGRTSSTGWAQYFTRYSSFMPPVGEGKVRSLPGNNACYPRDLLLAHADLLQDGFWEAEFNEAVRPLWMLPRAEVIQHQERGFLEYVPLRYRHGRCYGGRRAKKQLWSAPMIPLVLYLRAARAAFRNKRHRGKFLLASPLLLIYFAAWGAGELIGYLWGSGLACPDTD